MVRKGKGPIMWGVKRILIATDGSPPGTEPVSVRIDLAAEQGAAVTFVHVVPLGPQRRELVSNPTSQQEE